MFHIKHYVLYYSTVPNISSTLSNSTFSYSNLPFVFPTNKDLTLGVKCPKFFKGLEIGPTPNLEGPREEYKWGSYVMPLNIINK